MQPLRACLLAAVAGTALSAAAADLWIDVPFVPQTRDGCGAASIAMVQQYWQKQQGRPATADAAQIMRVLDPAARNGIPAAAMLRYFQQNGYRAVAFSAAWPDLERELQQGRPLIAALEAGGGRELHYVVVAGIDDSRSLVLVNDPAQRKLLKEDRSQFERAWKASGHWILLAVPDTARAVAPTAPAR